MISAPADPRWRFPRGTSRLEYAAAGLFWFGFLANFFLIAGRLVDFPYLDEWTYIRPEAFGLRPESSFLFRQRSDHLMVTSHLQAWALFRLAGWNLATGAAFNYFFVFGLIPLLLARVGRMQLGHRSWVLWLILISILTPFNPYHQFGLLMVGIEHYIVLFLLSVLLLFGRDQGTWRLLLGSVSAVGATYAVGAGAVSSSVTLALFGAYKYVRIRLGEPRRRELAQAIVVAALIAPAVAVWLLSHEHVASQPPITYPTAWEFWRFLLALAALAVGQPGSVGCGALLILLTVLPVLLTARELTEGQDSAWVRLAITTSVLAAALAIAAARTGFGFERAVVTWHYHGLVELLVPMAFLGWCASTGGRRLVAVSTIFGAGLSLLMWDSFTIRSLDIREERVLAGRRCVVEKLARGMPVDCPATFHTRLDEKLVLARERGLSFYRRLEVDVSDMRAARSWVNEAVYRVGGEIDFRSTGDAVRFQSLGWSSAESWATWTVGRESRLALRIEGGPPADLELRARVTPFVHPRRPTQAVEVVANGTPVGRWTFSLEDAGGTERTAIVPGEVAREQSPLELAFRIADPRSPAELGAADPRELGIAFTTLSLSARDGTWTRGATGTREEPRSSRR